MFAINCSYVLHYFFLSNVITTMYILRGASLPFGGWTIYIQNITIYNFMLNVRKSKFILFNAIALPFRIREYIFVGHKKFSSSHFFFLYSSYIFDLMWIVMMCIKPLLPCIFSYCIECLCNLKQVLYFFFNKHHPF